jgi:hypothetical protein
MTNVKTTPKTDFQINATQNDVARILNAQYVTMDRGEARAHLERTYSTVWTEDELVEQFEVSSFDPPYANVIRKLDGQRGTVAFIDSPRFYFDFHSEEKHDAGTP